MRQKVEAVARELQDGALRVEPAKGKLSETRNTVVADWMATVGVLRAQGETELASEVEWFVKRLPSKKAKLSHSRW